MTTPLHQHASVPLHGSPTLVHRLLVDDPSGLVAQATAAALTRIEPLVRSVGLAPPTRLPTSSARVAEPGTVGSLELRWTGDEDATTWPALSARVLVVPEPADGARLVFVSPRSVGSELATPRLDRPQRRRIVAVAVQAFLRELAGLVGDPFPDTPRWSPTWSPLGRFDRRSLYVHHLEATDLAPYDLVRELVADPHGLAIAATSTSLAKLRKALAAGRFHEPATPSVQVAATPAGSLGILDLEWTGDEEATGWPAITLGLAVEAIDDASRLVVVSRRRPGYDLTVNRMDKSQRDQVLRELGGHVARALTSQLPSPQVAAPQVAAPEVAAPQIAAPEVAAPEVAAPEPTATLMPAPRVHVPSAA